MKTGTRRRSQSNDELMADDPPRVLGFAIPVVAALLVLSLVGLRLVEYQDTVPVSLTLKTEVGRAYGEAYLEPGQAGAVHAEQVVDIDLGGRRLRAKVGDVSAFDTHSFYRVRVDLPPDFAPPDAIQVQARILTQRENLFDKLFGAFRVLSRNL